MNICTGIRRASSANWGNRVDTEDYPFRVAGMFASGAWDVILLGEMRDHETIRTARTAAETGHLLIATLHTRGAVNTVDRIIDAFPPEQQAQIRVQLSMSCGRWYSSSSCRIRREAWFRLMRLCMSIPRCGI